MSLCYLVASFKIINNGYYFILSHVFTFLLLFLVLVILLENYINELLLTIQFIYFNGLLVLLNYSWSSLFAQIFVNFFNVLD